jgi:hypothetical protein
MYAKLKTNLIGLAAALSFVVVGFSLGEAPSAYAAGQVASPALAQVDADPALAASEANPAPGRRGALRRHLAMPYVSFAALLPRQES